MSVAELIVEVGFSAPGTGTALHLDDAVRGLLDTGTLAADDLWVDVTEWVTSVSTRRGATRADGPILRYEAGTATLGLRNEDRRFDPTNLGASIGLVIGDSSTPTAGDQAISTHISGLGYRVTYIDDSASVPGGYDAYVLLESCVVATLGSKYDTVATPVLCMEHLVWQEMRLASADGAPSVSGTDYDLAGSAITSGLPDPLTVRTAAATYRSAAVSTLPAAAELVATEAADSTKAVCWVVDTGQAMSSGTAPARRIALGWNDSWSTGLADGGVDLLDALMAWLLPSGSRAPYVAAGVTQVEPMRAVRMRAAFGGVTYPLWRGFADEWQVGYEGPSASTVTLTCSDALAVFASYDRSASASVGAGEDAGARIDRILDSISWPATDRLITAGDSTVQATTLSANVLTELFLTADSELGELYMDADGRVAFRNRLATFTDTRTSVSQATFGDESPELPYTDVTVAYDAQSIYNLLSVARTGGTAQVVEDAASRTAYLTRTYQRTDLLLESDTECLDYAGYLLHQSSQPELRFADLTLTPSRDDLLWAQALGREIGDRVTVIRRPPGGGDPIERDVIVRGISHEVTADKRWRTVLTLQSATKLSYLVLDDPVLGVLDSNALAY